MPVAELELILPELHDGQAAIVATARRFNVLRCGRRFGKTALGVDLAIQASIDGGPVGWFAPSYKILLPAWDELVRSLRPVVARVAQQDRRLELIGGGVIECWSLEGNPDVGRSRAYKCVILDEAALMRNLDTAWEQAIRPTLADLRGDAWFLSTPRRISEMAPEPSAAYFEELYQRGQAEDDARHWQSWTYATADNPYMPPGEIEAARLELPPEVFAQEFLGIPMRGGARNAFFPQDVLQMVQERDCREPVDQGEIEYTCDVRTEGSSYRVANPAFRSGYDKERVLIWEYPRKDRNYVGFADISCGVGASNSCIKIGCVDNLTEVCSFATPDLPEEEFARYSIALCQWYTGQDGAAMIGYEDNGGAGVAFGRELHRCGYAFVAGDFDLTKPRGERVPCSFGWHSTRDEKKSLLSDLRTAWRRGEFHTRDASTVTEAGRYVYYPSMAVGVDTMAEDPDGARAAHGDRVIAAGGLWLMMRQRGKARSVPQAPHPMSMDGRTIAIRRQRSQEGRW